MSTYLQLCQQLRSDLEIPGQGPASVVNQVGLLRHVVDWIARANREIQKRDATWDFMQVTVEKDTVADQSDYNFVTDWSLSDVRTVNPRSFWLRRKADGFNNQRQIILSTYQEFLEFGVQSFNISQSQFPRDIMQLPNRNIRFGPPPNDVYAVQFDYTRKIQLLTADGDISFIPSDYEDAILGKAMMYYGKSQDARDILSDGTSRFEACMTTLEDEQLPQIQFNLDFL